MVLKKSNSRLNSGATQRIINHEGIHKLNNFYSWPPYILDVENYLLLTTDIKMSHPKAKTSLHACVEEMYTYLGFDMPDLSHLTNRKFKSRNIISNSAKHIKEYSLNKHNMWLLPERITQMKSDIDFLRCLTQNLEVRFHDVRDNMITTSSNNRSKSLKTKTITSSEIIAKSSECDKQPSECDKQPSECDKQPPEPTTSRRRQTSHGRGVQRSHLFTRKHKQGFKTQKSEDEGREEKLGHLDLYLYAPYNIHARSVYCKMDKKFARCHNTSRLKSSTKMNGRNKGKFPCRLGYCKRDLEVDTLNAIYEVNEDNTDSSVFMDNDELNTNHTPISRDRNYDITDFITVRRRRMKGEKRNKRKRATREDEGVENCAELCNRIRHPKGSFLPVSKDTCCLEHVEPREITMSLPREHNSNFALSDSRLAQKIGQQVGLDVPTTENTTKAFQQKDICDFDDGFVLVSLTTSEEREKWISFSQDRKNNEVLIDNKFPVKFGDSCPECFVVECNPDKMHTSGQHWRLLIGRRRESGSDLWLVSIQDQWQTPTQTKQHLQKLTTDCRSFSIGELINIVTSLDSREITTQPRQTSRPVKEKWLSSNFVWRNMPLNICTMTESCTVEEATNILEEEYAIDRNVPKRQTTSVESDDDSLVTQCGVCLVDYDYTDFSTSLIVLLPCSHTYCVCCWRAHLQYCIRNGANSMACMSTNCTNVMDITTISTILPYTLVQCWQAQVRNRRIDSSPFCGWCPNVACDKVVVSRTETLKEQFGKVIACVCHQCWCSGCQGDPHWPASCDQMAAYRKLLTKTDSKLMFSESDPTVHVDVKRCPGCRYPIEKNEGCMAMNCSMCGHIFCWNCLEKSHTHGVCKQKNIQTATHLLSNTLEIRISFNWYRYCLMLNRRMASIQNIDQWLHRIRMKATSSLILSLPAYTTNQAATIAALRAEDCVLFLKQAYTLQESMHVLTGFAELSECRESKFLAKRALSKMFRLDFITWRLAETILEKSLLHLCKIDTITTHLLQAGRNVMRELSVLAPVLQRLSKDVETTSVGELHPKDLIYYK